MATAKDPLFASEQNIKVEGQRGDMSETDKDRHQVNVAEIATSKELTHQGQRRVNLIWEVMQASIALSVVGTVLYIAARISLLVLDINASEKQAAMAITAFMLLSNLVSLVIGFYFGRTNHQKTGGVGINDEGR